LLLKLTLGYLNTSGTFSPQDYADRIADLFKQSKIMGCGKATAKAVAKLNRGILWDKGKNNVYLVECI
jgi:ADP-ribosylglycohydrolase